MKLVLRDNVQGLGQAGDVVEVADGYARNFLVPKGLAFRATEGTETQAQVMRQSRDVKSAKARDAAQEVARVLVPQVINIGAQAGPEGRLFGSVSAGDISTAVKDQTGLEVDRRQINLEEPLKELGTHTVMAKLHPEVEFPITVEVASA
ncbi:MAG: 50S ribosomal protein L9 [Actinomycetia bacterium]|nr:50S ribosomal protein L9 [Actinomycetes bacterium]